MNDRVHPVNELAQMLLDQAEVMNHNFQLGLRAGKSINREAYRILRDCWSRAKADEKIKIPSYLECAIEQVLRLREEDEANAYADVMMQKDAAERHGGRTEHDLDVVGRALRAGT